jgi:hypothetical protein
MKWSVTVGATLMVMSGGLLAVQLFTQQNGGRDHTQAGQMGAPPGDENPRPYPGGKTMVTVGDDSGEGPPPEEPRPEPPPRHHVVVHHHPVPHHYAERPRPAPRHIVAEAPRHYAAPHHYYSAPVHHEAPQIAYVPPPHHHSYHRPAYVPPATHHAAPRRHWAPEHAAVEEPSSTYVAPSRPALNAEVNAATNDEATRYVSGLLRRADSSTHVRNIHAVQRGSHQIVIDAQVDSDYGLLNEHFVLERRPEGFLVVSRDETQTHPALTEPDPMGAIPMGTLRPRPTPKPTPDNRPTANPNDVSPM